MLNRKIKAAQIVQTILEKKVFFGELKKQIAEQDLPLINMLILTALRHWTPLQKLLSGFLKRKIPHKQRMAEYLIMLAMAEILYMETPVYAVVDETVDAVKKTADRFLGGLTNAVLRKVIAQKSSLLAEAKKFSPLPETFRQILCGYDEKQCRQIEDCISAQPPLDLTIKQTPEKYVSPLSGVLLPSGTVRITATTYPDFSENTYWAQDAAAALPVLAMGEVKNKKIVDLCAAPGGKTAQLAAAGAIVTAVDISEKRLDTLKTNMARLELENVNVVHANALDFLQNTNEKFDMILLDAPCSATGTFRRHPEILHIKTIDDVKQQQNLQLSLLQACDKALNIGGILLYSVCSISLQEGEQQIDTFLQQNKNFKIVPIEQKVFEKYGHWQENLITEKGTVRTLPFYEKHIGGMDSFFICKMQRII